MSEQLATRALDLAYAQLRSQKDDLRHLRGQAQISAAVSGLIASVFSSLTRASPNFTAQCSSECFLGVALEFWFVFLMLILALGFAARAAFGWKECTFDLNPTRYDYAIEHKEDFATFCRSMALTADGFFKENEIVLDETKKYLMLSCSIPDDHIDPRRSAFFMARSVLRDILSGVRAC